MTIQYQLTEDDFLQQQLYSSSKSAHVQNQRRKSWILIVLASLAVAYLFWQQGNHYMMYATLFVALITLIFYPLFQKRQYFNHYKRFIADTYKGRFNAVSKLEFKGDHIFTHDITGDSTILWSAVGRVVEISKHIFIEMQTGGSLIIAKTGIKEIELLRAELKATTNRLGISYSEEFDWKWK